MNPVTKALSDIKFKIPKPILQEAFIERQGFGQFQRKTPLSLDYRIREEVIEARVLEDCNLVGGKEVTIPLHSVQAQYMEHWKTIWAVPLELTDNRRITRVYSLIYGEGGVPTHTNLYNTGGSVYEDAASGLMASHMPIPNISNAEIALIGENTVMAHMHIPPSPNLYLRAVVEADSDLSHLNPASIPVFSKLVEYAVKSYIYNKLIIEIDEAYLRGGQQLGRFMSIIEEYADAEELYQEFFNEKWRKIALFSDDQARKRHLKMVTGGRH